MNLEDKINPNSSVFDQYILKNKKAEKRKNYVKNTVIAGLTIASLITGMNCKKGNPFTPPPPDNIYNIKIDGMAISEGFPNLPGASIQLGDQTVNPGATTSYNATEKGDLLELYMTGGHNEVLCLRTPNGTYNWRQSQNGLSVSVDLPNIPKDGRSGANVHLILYKIPTSINIDNVKEALHNGTAVYDHAVTFQPVNDGYPANQFEKIRTDIQWKANNALNQISNIYGVPGCSYDPTETDNNYPQKIRLSPTYVNAGHGESGSGVMTNSLIKITYNAPIQDFLEELYQAMGVRDDIGTDHKLKDDISGSTGTLNQFGRNLMLINYFLDPGTIL